MTNNAAGVITFHTDVVTCGCGGTHTWVNNGSLTTDAGTTAAFTGPAAGVVFSQGTGGTFTDNGQCRVQRQLHHLPADLGGCGGGNLTGDVSAGTTVRAHNTTTSALILGTSGAIANHGTITQSVGVRRAWSGAARTRR